MLILCFCLCISVFRFAWKVLIICRSLCYISESFFIPIPVSTTVLRHTPNLTLCFHITESHQRDICSHINRNVRSADQLQLSQRCGCSRCTKCISTYCSNTKEITLAKAVCLCQHKHYNRIIIQITHICIKNCSFYLRSFCCCFYSCLCCRLFSKGYCWNCH